MEEKRIYGIDLGTTYSCIACINESAKPEVIINAEGDATTPSVIYFESADKIVVGKVAKHSAKIYPDRTFAFIKRDMGHETVYEVDGVRYNPEQMSSFILRKLVNDASMARPGERITDVVITCPAYFGINEREATRNAGKLAGLNVRDIVNEPTAAAICYGLDREGDQIVMVYDLGGGTFDITMIKISGGNVEVIHTDGIHSLGGKDWDDLLVNHFAAQFKAQNPGRGDPRDDPESLQAMVTEAEECKKILSTRESYTCSVSHAGARARVVITREEFQKLTRDLLGQTITLTDAVIKAGKAKVVEARKREWERKREQDPTLPELTPAELEEQEKVRIDKILLVGGSSLMPAVSERLKEFDIVLQLFEPHLAVAKGAALVGLKVLAADLLKEEIAAKQGTDTAAVDLEQVGEKTLQEAATAVGGKAGRLGAAELVDFACGKIVNVTSKGFGVVAQVGERFEHEEVVYLIHNNTPLPVEITETGFGTQAPRQRSVAIRVMEQAGQEESPALGNNIELKRGEIVGLPSDLPAGSPIHVTFRLAADGTLAVSACEPSSGKDLKLEVTVHGVMSREEVEAAKGLLMKKAVS